MRRHARSENRTIVRKLSDAGEVAEIGSRIFPLRSPPAPMPSVGTRRSTRVFVPKATAGSTRDGAARPLRSSKRVAASKKRADGEGDEWLRMFGGAGEAVWWKGEGDKGGLSVGAEWHELVASQPDPNCVEEQEEPIGQEEPAGSLKGKMFEIVYSRKRRKSRLDVLVSSSWSKDRKYGIVYTRKRPRKKPKVTPSVEFPVEEATRETGIEDREHDDAERITRSGDLVLEIPESSRNFAEMAGISGGDLCTGFGGRMALVVLVESLSSSSSYPFPRILISIIRWMRRARLVLWFFAASLFSKSLAGAFSLHGIHFLQIRRSKTYALSANAIPGFGFCKIYGARKFVPLVSLDFSALPLYFKSLHVTLVLGSQYIPGVLARYLMDLNTNFSLVARSEEYDSHVPVEAGYSRTEVTGTVIPAVKRNESSTIAEATEPVAWSTVIAHGSRLQKHQRKRRSLGNHRIQSTVLNSQIEPPADHRNGVVSLPASSCSRPNSLVEPVHVKPHDVCVRDLFSITEEDDTLYPLRSHQKRRKSSRKSLGEGLKELKSALAEVKQNIDSVRCNANILVTDTDRCWREEAAEVMLEFSGSKEWCIAVKSRGTMRYLHKPQDMRPCVVNRFTHAYMWAGEDSWKLEFCDKWDWHVFKELHMECRDRNMQEVPVKIIPIPGVRIVSGYEEIATSSFARSDMYIHTMDDEVGRALARKNAYYDMDSGDEEWLRQLNSSSFVSENNGPLYISEDIFEKIIFVLEKDAYNHPDDISDKERAIDLCQDLGRRDMVAAVFDYWSKKRNKRHAALIKVFQGPPLKRAQLIQKPFLRKKRSFKRQRSQTGRCKQDFFSQAGAKNEAMRRVQEAGNAAKKASESAIRLRTRAQMFMSNAELAAYRSVMALRIAEAKRVSESSDLVSAVLD